MQPDASIIIPCYNNEQYVGEAIESALGQTYEPMEVIVIDDGSTDGSLDTIRSFDEQITWRTGGNKGACHARNWGAELASGAYLMFLDADDRIALDTVGTLVEVLRDKEHAMAACPWRRLRRENGAWKTEEPAIPFRPPTGDPIYDWLFGWYIPTCALLWSREAYVRTGGWDENLAANQDGDIALRALIKGTRLVHARSGRGFYRQHENTKDSISSSKTAPAIHSRETVAGKAAALLRERGQLDRYRAPIGKTYYRLARITAVDNPARSRDYLRRAKRMAGSDAITGSLMHRLLSGLLGLQRKQKLAAQLAKVGIGRRSRRKE
jgi:glycosyltransferase involved in cell wall biosynthesis